MAGCAARLVHLTKLPIALALAARGFRVFPIKPGAKSPPLLHDWPANATSDAKEVETLWAAVPEANVGIHCTGLVVVDVDPRSGGDRSYAILDEIHRVSHTLTTRTPSGGRHLFYRLPAGHPGVSNSVGRLGPGLDVRSTGGYVVGPGSDTEAGRYHFEADTPIAPCPPWLLDLLSPVAPRAERPATPVADAPDASLQRAQAWLTSHPGAVEGQGGDAHTYATACRLRDFGVSEAQCVELLTVWNRTCSPPWLPNELGAKARNAYRYAQEAKAGKAGVVASDLPAVPNSGPIVPKAGTPMRLDELAERSAASDYLVKGVLQKGAYVVAFGDRGEGKTFIALDIAYHVAAGTAWMDKLVKQGPVLYLAFEGAGGLAKRARALRQHYGSEQVPFYVDTAGYNLRDKAGREELGATVHALPEMPVLIVIDTFAHALRGGDENSAQDVGAFNTAVVELIKHTGATVLVIHHSGKNKNAGPRGSSALGAAIDAELEIDGGKVTATKQRDIELGDPIGFKLHPLVVGTDSDGDEITSCVVVPSATPVDELPALKGNPRNAMSVLASLATDNAPVAPEAWMEGCAEFYGQHDLRRKFFEVKRVLLDRGYILQDNEGNVTRRLQ